MFAQPGPKAHPLFSLLVLVAVTVILLLVAPATAQQLGASQPSGRYFALPAPQDTNPPPVHIPVARDKKKLPVRAMNSFAPAFSTAVYPSGGDFTNYVAVGDLNRDGWPDLVVSNRCAQTFNSCPFTGGSVSVFLGYGGGGFGWPTTYLSGGTYTYAIAIADVNGDGILDVLAANSCNGYYCFSIGELLGSGGGSLQPVQQYSSSWPGGGPSATAMADLNGDGILDLVTVSRFVYGSGSVYVQLGNADGTFQPPVVYDSGGAYALGVAIADVNGDGYLDILAVNQCADTSCSSWGIPTGSVGVLTGNGDGTFQPTISFGTGGLGSESITVADVNLDGKPDLLVPNDCNNSGTCPSGGGTVGVLINATPYTATTTALVSSVNPSRVRQAVTFTATVKATAGTPPDGEMITFKNGATIWGTAPLSAGTASLTTAALPVGTFAITATYAFDGTYGASVSPQLNEQVNVPYRYSTWTSLTASPNPSWKNQTVTFTATVKRSWGTIPDAERVTFYNGTTAIGTAVTLGGVAMFSTSSLAPGTYSIKAIYSGDPYLDPSAGTVQLEVCQFFCGRTETSE